MKPKFFFAKIVASATILAFTFTNTAEYSAFPFTTFSRTNTSSVAEKALGNMEPALARSELRVQELSGRKPDLSLHQQVIPRSELRNGEAAHYVPAQRSGNSFTDIIYEIRQGRLDRVAQGLQGIFPNLASKIAVDESYSNLMKQVALPKVSSLFAPSLAIRGVDLTDFVSDADAEIKLRRLGEEAILHRVASVSTYQRHFKYLPIERLKREGIRIGGVVAFPDGLNLENVERSVEDARRIIEGGGNEIDLVMDYRSILGGQPETSESSLKKFREGLDMIVRKAGVDPPLVKTIIETQALNSEENIRTACRVAFPYSDKIKMVTGFPIKDRGIAENRGSLKAAQIILEEIKKHYETTGELKGLKITGGIWYWNNLEEPDRSILPYYNLAVQVLGEELAYHFLIERNLFRIGGNKLLTDLSREVEQEKRVKRIQEFLSRKQISWENIEGLARKAAALLSHQRANVVFEWNQRENRWLFRHAGIELEVDHGIAEILGLLMPGDKSSLLFPLRNESEEAIYQAIMSGLKGGHQLKEAFRLQGLKAISGFKKVLLIAPYGDQKGRPLKYVTPAKGVEYISSLLIRELEDVDSRVYNPNLTSVDALYEFIRQEKFDVIGFSLLQGVVEKNMEILAKVHTLQLDALIMLGGHELPRIVQKLESQRLSSRSLPILGSKRHPFLDFVEAVPVDIYVIDPTSALGVMKSINHALKREDNLNQLKEVSNLLIVQGNEVVRTSNGKKFFPTYSSTDEDIPFFSDDLVHGTRYSEKQISADVPIHYDRIGNNPLRVVLSDFCSAHCCFCGVNEFKRPPPPVDEVIKTIRENFAGHDSIHFEHVDFLFNIDYAKSLAVALRDSEFRDVPKIIVARVGKMTDEIGKLFSEAGIKIIAYGIESFNDDILKQIGKDSTESENIHALDVTLKNGIRPGMNMIFFTPWDTLDTMKHTADLATSYALQGAYLNIVPIVYAGYGRPIADIPEILDYKVLDYGGMKKPLTFPLAGRILNAELKDLRDKVEEIKDELDLKLEVPDEHKTVAIDSLLWVKAFYMAYAEKRPQDQDNVSEKLREVDRAISQTVDAQMQTLEGKVIPFIPDQFRNLTIPPRDAESSFQMESYIQTKFPESMLRAVRERSGSIEIHRGPFVQTQIFLKNMIWRGYQVEALEPESDRPSRFFALRKGAEEKFVVANIVGHSRELFILQTLNYFGYPPHQISIRQFQYNLNAIYDQAFGDYRGKINQLIIAHEVDRYAEIMKVWLKNEIVKMERVNSDMASGYVVEFRSGSRVALFEMQYANGQQISDVIDYFAKNPEEGGIGVKDITVHGAAGIVSDRGDINDILIYTDVFDLHEGTVVPSLQNDVDKTRFSDLLQGTDISSHALPFYTLPTVLNGSVEIVEMIEKGGGGAIELELSHAIQAMKKYPTVKFRAFYEVHDKPANQYRSRKESLGVNVPGYKNRKKREAGWKAIQRYVLEPAPIKANEGFEKLRQFKHKVGQPVKVNFVALSAPEFPTFSETYGISSIAGDLKSHFQNDVDIAVFDMNANLQLSIPQIIEAIARNSPDMIAISAPFYSFQRLQELLVGLKKRFSDQEMPLLVIGKSLPNYQYERLLNEHFPEIITVQGEGEVAMRDLIRYRKGEIEEEGIKNVAYRKDGKIVVNRRESLDLATVGFPYRDHLSNLVREGGQVFIETSRGCYWSNCVFCAIRGLLGSNDKDKQWRTFPVEHVIGALQELDHRAKTENANYANISFADEEFLGHSEAGLRRAIELAEGIKKRELNIKFRISTTAKSVWDQDDIPALRELRKKALKELKEAGLEKVFLGLESGSDSQLKKLNKGITAEENRNAVLLLRDEIGIEVDVGFIMFNPLSTFEELKENVQFVEMMDVWQSITSLFNEARVYTGTILARLLQSKYPTLISKDYDMETGNFDVKFLDPKMSQIYDIVKEWERGDHLVEYHLKTMTRNKVVSGLSENFLYDALVRWRKMNLDLLKGLIDIFSREADPRAIAVLVEKLRSLRLDYARSLLQLLNENGALPEDQKNALKESLRKIFSDETSVPNKRSEMRATNAINERILSLLTEGTHSSVRQAFELFKEEQKEDASIRLQILGHPPQVAQILPSTAIVITEQAFADYGNLPLWRKFVQSFPVVEDLLRALKLSGVRVLLDANQSLEPFSTDEKLVGKILEPMESSESKMILNYDKNVSSVANEIVLLARPRGTYNQNFLKELIRRIKMFGYSVQAIQVSGGQWIEKNGIIARHAQDRAFKNATGVRKPSVQEKERLDEIYDHEAFMQIYESPPSALPVIPVFSLLDQGLTKGEITHLWLDGLSDKELNAGKVDGINKIGDHFFVRPVTHQMINAGKPFFLANGFYFEFEEPFHDPSTRVVAFIIRTTGAEAASWDFMRTYFQGETDPQKALPGSIRRDAFDGVVPVDAKLSVSQPALHMSASPLEVLKEMQVWFHLKPEETTFGRALLNKGYVREELEYLLSNPGLKINDQDTDLFHLIADKDFPEVATIIEKYFPPFGNVKRPLPSMTFRTYLETLQQYADGIRSIRAQQYPSSKIRKPASLFLLPDKGSVADADLAHLGEEAFRNGKAGQLFIVGGRQGRFMGYDVPESQRISRAFASGLEADGTPRSFFELALRHNQWSRRQYGARIPAWIMTSELNREGIQTYLKQNQYYGLPASDVRFFAQGELWMFNPTREDLQLKFPNASAKEINLWLSKNNVPGTLFRFSNGRIATRPPGHFDAIVQLILSGELNEALNQGVQYLYISDPSNAGLILDPALLGYMFKNKKEAVTTFVQKNTILHVKIVGYRKEFTAYVRDGVVVANNLPLGVRILQSGDAFGIVNAKTGHAIASKIRIEQETGGVLINDGVRDFVLEGFRFEPGYDQSVHRHYASAYYLINLKALLERLNLSVEKYRELLKDRPQLLRHIEEAIGNVETYIDVKKVVDEFSGGERFGAQFIQLIGSVSELLDTAFLTVDRDGQRTRVGYVGNKTPEDVRLNENLTRQILGSHVSLGAKREEIMTQFPIIVIDGWTGTGKTSLAKAVVDELGYVWLEFSALFRAASWYAGTLKVDNWNDVVEQVVKQQYEIKVIGREQQIFVNGKNITSEIYPDPADPIKFHERGSQLAADSRVQMLMQGIFRTSVQGFSKEGVPLVISGRTVGRDIFPEVKSKFFLTADVSERARRFAKGYPAITEEAAKENIMFRDELDAQRGTSPVGPSSDALVVDTSELSGARTRELIFDYLELLIVLGDLKWRDARFGEIETDARAHFENVEDWAVRVLRETPRQAIGQLLVLARKIRADLNAKGVYEKFDSVVQRGGRNNLIFLGETGTGKEIYVALSSNPKIKANYSSSYFNVEEALEKESMSDFVTRLTDRSRQTGQGRPFIFVDRIDLLLQNVHHFSVLKELLPATDIVIVGHMPIERYAHLEAAIAQYDEKGHADSKSLESLSKLSFQLQPFRAKTNRHTRIVVLGATGLIGKKIFQELKVRGYENVVGVSRTGDPVSRVLAVDLKDAKALREIVKDADVVINAAVNLDFQAMEGIQTSEEPRKVNVGIAENIANSGFKGKFIQLSSYYVFGEGLRFAGTQSPKNPSSVYGRMKLEAEKIAETLPDHMIIRVGSVIGYDPSERQKAFYKKIVTSLDGARRNQSPAPISVRSASSNALISPEQVAENIVDLLELDYRGVAQVSGKENLSEEEQAQRITAAYNQLYGTQLNLPFEIIEGSGVLRPNVQMLSIATPDLDEAVRTLIASVPTRRSELREGVVDRNGNQERLQIISPVTDRDLFELKEAVQVIQSILSKSAMRSELRQAMNQSNLIKMEHAEAYAYDRRFNDIGFTPVIGAYAKMTGQPVSMIATTRSELRMIEEINQTLGKIYFNGKEFDPILPAESPEQAAKLLRSELRVGLVDYVYPEGFGISPQITRFFSGIVEFKKAAMQRLELTVQGLLEARTKARQVAERIAQMA